MANPTPTTTPTRKSVTGFVTKLVGDGATYGFINDEIFFQQTNVTDGPAGQGDRVFAECEYSELLPIKWNATSIKIIGRASSGPANNILDSDPRRQSRQGLLNQQQPAPVAPNQSIPAANTYQQHRQQQQQQQHQRQPQQHDVGVGQASLAASLQQPPPQQQQQQHQQPPNPTIGLLDQAGMNQQPDFFSPFAQPPPQLPDLQAFQHDMPMGPPKLEYTSQLGSAFVQNQFMAGPLLPQPPAQQPMLPQHQPQIQQQQQHQRQQQQQQHQSNHRDQRGARDSNNKNRFNDKNDRNQSGRGRNRAERKYDQPRSSERDNSSGQRSSRSNDSRERSTGHGDNRTTKRDDSNTSRQSPAPNTNRSGTGTSSDRSHNKSAMRRHYDAQNIPKTNILGNLNGCNMRSRCSSSVHVPSDLKSVIVNSYLRLDVKNTPKPISFKIMQQAPATGDDTKQTSGQENNVSEAKLEIVEAATNEDAASQSSLDNKPLEQVTPPSSRSDTKLNHKYGVKVVLISLPELDTIYKKVFGNDMDSFTNESRAHPRLEEAICLLCNKAPNGGHSLIGGKFDPTLDGFVEGETNEFERYGKQPDLIATCRRVVQEHTGLDLGPCQGWTLVSTFLYNNKSDYFSAKSSVEYSFIYLPHIWSMKVEDLTSKSNDTESQLMDTSAPVVETTNDIGSSDGLKDETPASHDVTGDAPSADDVDGATATKTDQVESTGYSEVNLANRPVTLDNISDLKVAELKLELDKRDIKYKPNAKKAELALALQENLMQSSDGAPPVSVPAVEGETNNDTSQDANNDGQEQLEEGEVVADDDNTNDEEAGTATVSMETGEGADESNKRKSEELEASEEQDAKKVCKEEPKKTEKVELIKEPFMVKARPGQTQLSTLSLLEAVQASRYDQFELSVTSTILKESLTQHLSEYIFTTLIEESRQKSKEASDTSSTSSSQSNSQETNNNDTNNNQTGPKPAAAVTSNSSTDKTSPVKEYPVDRYVNLAFAYFDSTHMGYVQADDLFKLFNNTGMTISKRALWSLIGEGEKFNYRSLPDLLAKLPPNHVYKFPDQYNRLPGPSPPPANMADSAPAGSVGKMIEYQGVKYDIEKLIQQVRESESNQVNMVQRFNDAISKYDQQESVISNLEVNQLSLTKSIKELNAEISDLKREKLNADKRAEALRKQIKDAIKALSE